jgi:hypothetical protein
MNAEIVIVSGLPRSGTSLAMQMLAAGGITVLTDGERAADEDNPRGYLELEQVKKIKQDSSWLAGARGKAIKMISQLVFDLPASERYRVVLMQRDLDEILTSQEKMLARLGRPIMPREKLRGAFESQIARFDEWLSRQPNFAVLRVEYRALVSDAEAQASRINEFLGGKLDALAMASAVDPQLYRNRQGGP